MKYVGYYNGELGPLEEMKIPMLDRAVYFGDGCYDATTFANNRIFAAEDHLDRFYNSCRLLEIPFSMPREELVAELTAAMVARYYGMDKHVKEDSAAYLKSWLESLKEDASFIKTVLLDVKRAAGMLTFKIDEVKNTIKAADAT